MNKLEALEKIAELQKFIEELDKPKKVRAYIKIDSKGNCRHGWNPIMTEMLGGVYDVYEKNGYGGLRIYSDDAHSDWYNFESKNFVIVEGSYDDAPEEEL